MISYTTLQKLIGSLCLIATGLLLTAFPSCGLFDKELTQDKHIAQFRHQLSKVQDSLSNHSDRIIAYKTIVSNINTDKALISIRKKNNLLAESNIYISDEYVSTENYEEALLYADTVINIVPASPLGYYSKGCIYQITQNDSLAILNYSKAIKLNNDHVDAYYNRGIIYEQQGKLDQALVDYNKALKLNPSYIADVYINRGNVYLAKKAFTKAVEDYSTVIKEDTTNAKAYHNRAEAYLKQDNLDKALSDYDKVIQLDSTNLNAFIKRASVLELKKEYKEAIEDYEEALKLDTLDSSYPKDSIRIAISKLTTLVKSKKK